MNLLTLGIGIVVLCFGVISGILWFKKPGIFKKLEPMKKRWGNRVGSILHISAYVIIPLIFGVIVVIAGVYGIDIMALF